MPITFGSVGDIISISLILKDLVKALDDSRGSAAEYQEVIRELWSLDRVLLEVEQLSRNSEQTIELYALWVSAKRATDECRRSIESFLEKIKKYEKNLGGHTSGHTIRGVPMKIRWRLTQSEELDKFRTTIKAHCSSLGMLLIIASMNIAQLNAKKLHEAQRTAEESRNDAIQKQNGLLEELQSRFDRSTEVIKAHTVLIKDVMKFDWLRNLALDLKGLAKKICFVNLATFRMVAEIRSSLPSHLDRCLIQEPFFLEDAIGREAPVHLQFINSWDAFYAVLETRFRDLQGYNKIKNKEFVLQERATKRDISRTGSWEASFLPGQRVDMSITFTEIRQNVQLSCPRCQMVNENCSRQSTQCAGCSMWFTRVIELYDSDAPGVSGTSNLPFQAAQTATGIKLNTPINRVERGTSIFESFEVPVHGPKTLPQPEGPSSSKKHSRYDNELLTQEEIGRFKRVRMIHLQFRGESRTSKTDEALLSRGTANQGPKNNEPYPTKDPKTAISTPNSPNWLTVRSNSDDKEITAMLEVYSVTGSMDVNFEGKSGYTYENGRSYHGYHGGIYFLPNDKAEQERMEVQHHTIGLLLDGKLFLAPLQNPKNILEQGTGTGAWAIDIADRYEDSTVIGTDLSAIQPEYIPPNCRFEIDNINLPWYRDVDCYDFVFSRFGNGFTERNWDKYLSESFHCLAPGGWAEIQDMDFVALSDDDSLPQDSWINKWHLLICEGASRVNIDMRMSSAALKTKFENAGFINIKMVDKKLPMGPWPGCKDQKLDIGACQILSLLVGLEGFSLAIFCRCLGWHLDEVRAFLRKVRNDLRTNRAFHWYWPFFVVYGQKPVK